MAATVLLEMVNDVTMRRPKTDYGFDNKDIVKTVIIQKDRHGFVRKSTDDSLYCRVIESRLDLFNDNICITILSDDGIDDWDGNFYLFAHYEEDNISSGEFYGKHRNDFENSLQMDSIEINTDPNNYCVMHSIQFPLDILLGLCADTYDENKDYDAFAFYMKRAVVDPETSAMYNRYYVFRLDYKFLDWYLNKTDPDDDHYYFPVEVIGSIFVDD